MHLIFVKEDIKRKMGFQSRACPHRGQQEMSPLVLVPNLPSAFGPHSSVDTALTETLRVKYSKTLWKTVFGRLKAFMALLC